MDKMEESGTTEPGVQDDQDFEPTAEMMVNDFDDERTLDEEEAMEEGAGEQDEICDLEREKDIPIEDLLSMYGYNEEGGGEGDEEEEEEEEEEETAEGEEGDAEGEEEEEETSQSEEQKTGRQRKASANEKSQEVGDEIKKESPEEMQTEEEKPQRSLLHELYKDDPSVPGGSRQLRSGSRQASEDEEEEDDGDYSPEEDDWKKTIMVGSDYQAVIPDGLRKYDDAMPYENEDKLLWDPLGISESNLNKYLLGVHEIQNSNGGEQGTATVPQGSHIRDDEQALYLLQQCGHNVEEALRRQRINAASSVDTMSLWSEEECRNFEAGLRYYGKDFNMIQQNKVRTRSVSELVQFYYLWKKTERHDVFANKSRLEKKKYTLHPGTTDYMERFLDEQESPASSPNVHSLLSGDPKRQARTPPPVQSQHEAELITADEARLISTHYEDIARHLDKDSLDSLLKLAQAARLTNGVPGGSADVGNRNSCLSSCDSIITHSAAHSFAQ